MNTARNCALTTHFQVDAGLSLPRASRTCYSQPRNELTLCSGCHCEERSDEKFLQKIDFHLPVTLITATKPSGRASATVRDISFSG
jgi:hypothetical protein